jgi:hypothetical protein
MIYLDKIRQYRWRVIPRVIKSFLRKIGLNWESYLWMSKLINRDDLIERMKDYTYEDVMELTIEDFNKGDINVFDKAKRSLIQSRIESGLYKCYGIFDNNLLVYSTWLSLNKVIIPGSSITRKLSKEEGLLEDSYCHPAYRGRGYHSKMNLFRLKQLIESGRNKAIVVVIRENLPAYRTQIKSGFKIERSIQVLNIWGLTFEKDIKKNNGSLSS